MLGCSRIAGCVSEWGVGARAGYRWVHVVLGSETMTIRTAWPIALRCLMPLVLLGGGGPWCGAAPSLLGDLNCDGTVDFDDIDPFVLALSGSAGYEAEFPDCDQLLADCDGDGVVDFNDIDAFVGLLTGPPRLADYWDNGCEEPPWDDWFCNPDEVEWTVDGLSLRVLHTNAEYNCCIDEIGFTLLVDGNLLTLVEEEILWGEPCPCMCCYELEAVIVGLSPGHYTARLCWLEGPGWECDEQLVVIE